MLAEPDHGATLGADLRALRRSRGVTLEHLARSIGKSVGWVSQAERDLSTPSLSDLQSIARALGVPLSLFFGRDDAPAHERGTVVRAAARRRIGMADGLAESLLSPDLTDDFEVVHSTFAAGAARRDPVTRPTTEVGYIVSGRLRLSIAGVAHDLGPGDSFRIRGEPFAWENPHKDPAVVIWVISPPVY